MANRIVCLMVAQLSLLMIMNSHATELNFQMFKDKSYPNSCVVSLGNGFVKIIKSGEITKYPGRCAQISCGLQGWAIVHTCDPPKMPPEKCIYADYIDITKEFPECCERVLTCEWDNNEWQVGL